MPNAAWCVSHCAPNLHRSEGVFMFSPGEVETIACRYCKHVVWGAIYSTGQSVETQAPVLQLWKTASWSFPSSRTPESSRLQKSCCGLYGTLKSPDGAWCPREDPPASRDRISFCHRRKYVHKEGREEDAMSRRALYFEEKETREVTPRAVLGVWKAEFIGDRHSVICFPSTSLKGENRCFNYHRYNVCSQLHPWFYTAEICQRGFMTPA